MKEIEYVLQQLKALPKNTVITSNMLIAIIEFAVQEAATDEEVEYERLEASRTMRDYTS